MTNYSASSKRAWLHGLHTTSQTRIAYIPPVRTFLSAGSIEHSTFGYVWGTGRRRERVAGMNGWTGDSKASFEVLHKLHHILVLHLRRERERKGNQVSYWRMD